MFRPPLAPDHTGPVCRWEVTITSDAGVVEEHPLTHAVRDTRAGRFTFRPVSGDADPGGMKDYSGDFRPDFQLEDLSHAALVAQCKEFALDVHLLVRSGHLAVESRWGAEARVAVARDHWAGSAPVYGRRVRDALGIRGDDMTAILKTLQVDPAFPHEYVRVGCSLVDDRRGAFWIEECDGLRDVGPRGWLELLEDEDAPGLDAVVAAVNPRARCHRIEPVTVATGGAKPALAWSIVIDDAHAPYTESVWARAPRACSIAEFPFRTRPTSPANDA